MISNFYSKKNIIDIKLRILIPAIILILFSLIILLSTAASERFTETNFFKQLIWISLSIIIFIYIQKIRMQWFFEHAYFLYFVLIGLLCLTHYMPSVGGSSRWLELLGIKFQPSEIGKIIMIFTLAKFLSDRKIFNQSYLKIIGSLILIIMPAGIIFLQPDFGTAIIYFSVLFPMFLWSGINVIIIFFLIAPLVTIILSFNLSLFFIWIGIILLFSYYHKIGYRNAIINFFINISSGIVAPFLWNSLLKDYHRERILTLLNPMSDPQGSGYQIIQSMNAIGSGGLFGKGTGQGTQTQLRFLPVSDTDFILSVIGEELGLFGILIVMISIFYLSYWIITYSVKLNSEFFSLVTIGISSIIFYHFIINIGMTIGIFPVTGLPAPFLSYGGSFFLTCSIMIGICNNIFTNHI